MRQRLAEDFSSMERLTPYDVERDVIPAEEASAIITERLEEVLDELERRFEGSVERAESPD